MLGNTMKMIHKWKSMFRTPLDKRDKLEHSPYQHKNNMETLYMCLDWKPHIKDTE